MSAAGTPKASEAAIAAVQEALGCWAFNVVGANLGQCRVHFGRWTERGCPVAVAAADAAAPWIAAQALQDAAEETIAHRSWLRDRADQIEEGHDPR